MAQTKFRGEQIRFETSASNIKADGAASAGSLSTIARADHVHPNGDTGWINLTLLNGWQVYTAWGGSAAYRKVGKVVTVRLYCIYNTSNKSARQDAIATLPAGFTYNTEYYSIAQEPNTGIHCILRLNYNDIRNDTAYTANTVITTIFTYITD